MVMFLFFVSFLSPSMAECGFEGPCPNGALLPCPSDCTKYIQCDNGNPIERDCAPTTFFDSATSECSSYSCPWTQPPAQTTTATTITTTIPTTTTTTATTPEPVPTTPAHGLCLDVQDMKPCKYGTDGPEYYKDATDCSKFYMCEASQWCHFSCPHNQHYDPRPGWQQCRVKGDGPECIALGGLRPPRMLEPFHNN